MTGQECIHAKLGGLVLDAFTYGLRTAEAALMIRQSMKQRRRHTRREQEIPF
jgi:hypothetical protein